MLLEVEGVHAHYGDSHVLNGATLAVPAGAVVGLLGRNGVGKSTLVKVVTGLLTPSAGQVRLDGRRISGLPPERIADLGVSLVPQGRRVFGSLRVSENLSVAARTAGRWDLEAVKERFPVLRARWGQQAGSLSGGEQQLLATARALVRNGRLIVMDEPSEGLAPAMVDKLAEIIRETAADGGSVLLVEQKLAFALRLASHVFVMSRGEVVYEGSPAQLAEDRESKSRLLGV